MSLFRFINNLRYLFRYDIKDIYNKQKIANEIFLSRYEFVSKYLNYKKPTIKDNNETIDALINSEASICRFGDGEFDLMANISIPFQDADTGLAERLKEIIQSNEENCLIGISQFWESSDSALDYNQDFSQIYVSKKLKFIDKYIDREKVYYTTSFNQIYIVVDDYDFESYFNHMKEIWDNRDITIICGKGIFDKHQYNIFDNAKSIEYMYAPSKNAFSEYQKILDDAKTIPKDRLILIVLGPTATVLAYDLHKLGYRALDIGHCAKDYNAYKTKLEKNFKNCFDFYQPD